MDKPRKNKKVRASETRFDYKDPLSLYGFLDGGKIQPSRINNLSYSEQKRLAKACKTARSLGLLPSSFTAFDDLGRPSAISPQPFKFK